MIERVFAQSSKKGEHEGPGWIQTGNDRTSCDRARVLVRTQAGVASSGGQKGTGSGRVRERTFSDQALEVEIPVRWTAACSRAGSANRKRIEPVPRQRVHHRLPGGVYYHNFFISASTSCLHSLCRSIPVQRRLSAEIRISPQHRHGGTGHAQAKQDPDARETRNPGKASAGKQGHGWNQENKSR